MISRNSIRSSLVAIAIGALSAHGSAYFAYHYAMSFPSDSASFTIDNWFVLERSSTFSYGFRFPEGYGDAISAPAGGSLNTESLYPGYVESPASNALIIGLTHDLPGDAPGQEHIVLGMDSGAAGYAENIAWGTLFRNTLEDDLIYDLHHYVDPDQSVTQSALDGLVGYAFGDAQTGILDQNGNSVSAWFDPNGGQFKIETFSTGQIVGSGIATQVEINPTPEPASLAMLGVGAFALVRRRRALR